MARRHPNPRRIKIHRSYTVEEVAASLGVHKNTVRNWLRSGLEAIDSSRPTLIHGRTLAVFLQHRRQANKQRCEAGEIYCVRCRTPVTPAGNMADYLPVSATSGNLRGICPHCETLIHRRASLAQLDAFRGILDIGFPQAEARNRRRSLPLREL
jgi:hypothetical protein